MLFIFWCRHFTISCSRTGTIRSGSRRYLLALSIVLRAAIWLHVSGWNSLLFGRWGRNSTVFWFWGRCQNCRIAYVICCIINISEQSAPNVTNFDHCVHGTTLSDQICFARWRQCRRSIMGNSMYMYIHLYTWKYIRIKSSSFLAFSPILDISLIREVIRTYIFIFIIYFLKILFVLLEMPARVSSYVCLYVCLYNTHTDTHSLSFLCGLCSRIQLYIKTKETKKSNLCFYAIASFKSIRVACLFYVSHMKHSYFPQIKNIFFSVTIKILDGKQMFTTVELFWLLNDFKNDLLMNIVFNLFIYFLTGPVLRKIGNFFLKISWFNFKITKKLLFSLKNGLLKKWNSQLCVYFNCLLKNNVYCLFLVVFSLSNTIQHPK